MKLSREDFVRMYRDCNSLDEMAERSRMTRAAIRIRARRLREAGVRLSDLPAHRKSLTEAEIERLNGIAEGE